MKIKKDSENCSVFEKVASLSQFKKGNIDESTLVKRWRVHNKECRILLKLAGHHFQVFLVNGNTVLRAWFMNRSETDRGAWTPKKKHKPFVIVPMNKLHVLP